MQDVFRVRLRFADPPCTRSRQRVRQAEECTPFHSLSLRQKKQQTGAETVPVSLLSHGTVILYRSIAAGFPLDLLCICLYCTAVCPPCKYHSRKKRVFTSIFLLLTVCFPSINLP